MCEPGGENMDTMETSTTGPGTRKKSSASEDEKKSRNRLAQQRFRRKNKEEVRELKSRIEDLEGSESERLKAYQLENQQLRKMLVDLYNLLAKHQTSITSMCANVAKTLDRSGDEVGVWRPDAEEKQEEASENAKEAGQEVGPVMASAPTMAPALMMPSFSNMPNMPTQGLSVSGPPSYGHPVFGPNPLDPSSFVSPNVAQQHPANQQPAQGIQFQTSTELVNVAGTTPLYPQPSGIWSHQYQMGPESYSKAMNSTQEARTMLGRDFSSTNSNFSDHIGQLQGMLSTKLNGMGFEAGGQYPTHRIYQPVVMALSMFNSVTRPDVMAWYAKTRFYHIIELTTWQLFPSMATYNKLHPRYQPTDIQLRHQHPLVIDWIPFPALRDQLVQHHAANPEIDQIFCDAVTGYVVETPMATLIQGAPLATAYIRVTDLITAMDADKPGNDDTIATLPAPNITTLFSSPAYARAAFRKLNMDKGAGYYKIDPGFFEKYPELRHGSDNLIAAGIPLKPKQQIILTHPKPLDATTVQTYRSFIDFSIDAANTIS